LRLTDISQNNHNSTPRANTECPVLNDNKIKHCISETKADKLCASLFSVVTLPVFLMLGQSHLLCACARRYIRSLRGSVEEILYMGQKKRIALYSWQS
jgi:hypothetical protein